MFAILFQQQQYVVGLSSRLTAGDLRRCVTKQTGSFTLSQMMTQTRGARTPNYVKVEIMCICEGDRRC